VFVASLADTLPGSGRDARSEMPAIPNHASAKADCSAQQGTGNASGSGTAPIPEITTHRT